MRTFRCHDNSKVERHHRHERDERSDHQGCRVSHQGRKSTKGVELDDQAKERDGSASAASERVAYRRQGNYGHDLAKTKTQEGKEGCGLNAKIERRPWREGREVVQCS